MISNAINIAANINIHEILSLFVIPSTTGFLSFFVCLLSLLFLDIVNILRWFIPPFIQPLKS